MSVIKPSINCTSTPMEHIINLSITHGIILNKVKIAHMVPILKSGDIKLFPPTTGLSLFLLVSLNSYRGLYTIIPLLTSVDSKFCVLTNVGLGKIT